MYAQRDRQFTSLSKGSAFERHFLGTLAIVSASLSGIGCDDFWRSNAACEQTVVAYCAMRAHCGATESIETCESDRLALTTCPADINTATSCVEAINDVLASDCTEPGPPILACTAELERDTVYRTCSQNDVCSDALACIGLNTASTGTKLMCSQTCDIQSRDNICPVATNGFSALCIEGICTAGCIADVDCAEDMVCVNGACTPA